MKTIKIKPNKKGDIRVRGSFGFIYEKGKILLPVDFYNYLVLEGVSTLVEFVVFVQNHPVLICNILKWNLQELKRAHDNIVGHFAADIPDVIRNRPLQFSRQY